MSRPKNQTHGREKRKRELVVALGVVSGGDVVCTPAENMLIDFEAPFKTKALVLFASSWPNRSKGVWS